MIKFRKYKGGEKIKLNRYNKYFLFPKDEDIESIYVEVLPEYIHGLQKCIIRYSYNDFEFDKKDNKKFFKWHAVGKIEKCSILNTFYFDKDKTFKTLQDAKQYLNLINK